MLYIYCLMAVTAICIIINYVYTNGDILSPAFIALMGFFAAFLCIAYNEDYWNVTYEYETFGIVIGGILLILVVDFLFNFFSRTKRQSLLIPYPDYFYIIGSYRKLINIIMSIGLIWLFIELRLKGFSLGVSGMQVIGVVKESEMNFTTVGKIFYNINNLLLIITCFILAYNMGAGKQARKYTKYYIFPVILGFLTLLITGSRSVLFRTIFIYIITCLVSSKQHSDRQKIETKTLIKQAALPLVAITVMFYGLRAIVKVSSKSASRGFIEYVTYYIGSPLYLFNEYVINPTIFARKSYYFGAYTFAGFYNTLYRFGIVKNEVPNLNFAYLGGKNYLGGNECSLFMRPMHDFGIAGMYIFIIVLFSAFSYVYYFKIAKSNGSNKSYRVLMVYSYFFYIIALAFYYPFTVQEFKLMNIVYLVILIFIYKRVVKRGVVN